MPTDARIAQRTPGPWIVEPVPTEAYSDPDIMASEDEAFWISDGRANGHMLAAVYRYPRDQAEANARLIAAAPDLLENARLVAEGFSAGIFGRDASKGYASDWAIKAAPYLSALASLEAAIARAEEGTHHVEQHHAKAEGEQ